MACSASSWSSGTLLETGVLHEVEHVCARARVRVRACVHRWFDFIFIISALFFVATFYFLESTKSKPQVSQLAGYAYRHAHASGFLRVLP